MSVPRRHEARDAGVPVTTGALYPVFGLLLSPIIATAAMALSPASAIANALRLGLQLAALSSTRQKGRWSTRVPVERQCCVDNFSL